MMGADWNEVKVFLLMHIVSCTLTFRGLPEQNPVIATNSQSNVLAFIIIIIYNVSVVNLELKSECNI